MAISNKSKSSSKSNKSATVTAPENTMTETTIETTTDAPATDAPATNAPATDAPATKSVKTKKERKVRLYSQVAPTMYVRVFQSFIDQFGIPEHGGQPMVGKTSAPKSSVDKEARKALLAAMSDEEKLAYVKAERLAKQAEKDAKKNAEREALIAQVRADILAGKL